MTEIQRITTRDDLVALANKLGMRADWHEPDEKGVTARFYGKDFDNAGFWGEAEIERVKHERARGYAAGLNGLEMWVAVFHDGERVAEVNLATLFAFATGFEGER
jgi:hypothetical protein